MINTPKLAFVAAIAAFSITSPALAQLRDRGADTFTIVPPNSTIAPATNPEITGGGNSGYNESLVKNQW
jgi:hypothetical protein